MNAFQLSLEKVMNFFNFQSSPVDAIWWSFYDTYLVMEQRSDQHIHLHAPNIFSLNRRSIVPGFMSGFDSIIYFSPNTYKKFMTNKNARFNETVRRNKKF